MNTKPYRKSKSTSKPSTTPAAKNHHSSLPRSARAAAAQILCQLFSEKLPVKKISDTICAQANLDGRDRNFVMQLVYGVLRHRQELDRILQLLSTVSLGKLDPLVHQATVLGLYQLFFLDRIPESAAVNEAVNTLKKAGKPQRFQGFCNGILRESLRRRESIIEQAKFDDKNRPILNHPAWITDRWRDRFGQEETARICASNNREPHLVLRACSSRISREQLLDLFRDAHISATAGIYSEEAIVIENFSGSIAELPGFAEGFFQVQDEAAQLASLLLTPLHPGGCYLDGCAGLGGKTTHLLELAMAADAELHAVEPDAARFRLLQENIDRLFPDSKPHLHHCTLEEFSAITELSFDGILIDAPCSGTGVIGRQPDIRWHRQPLDIVHNHKQQLGLLHCAEQLLAPHGTIVYTTCSLETEENQDVVKAFLGENASFSIAESTSVLPPSAWSLCEGPFFSPHPSENIDGFFGARLIR